MIKQADTRPQAPFAIEVRGLEKSYGHNSVLRGVDIQVERGEIFALLGVNGAGKTTALECMEGLRRYESGQVTIHGQVGIQLQSASLPEHIKPLEAIKLFAKWNRVPIDWPMLESLGIPGLFKQRYGALSTGQKRRLHLALALLRNPDIVFLDEPTAGLDVEARLALHQQIRALKASGKTIILASHDMAEVETLCDRIAILQGGKIIFVGSVTQLQAKMSKRYCICLGTDRGEQRLEAENIGEALLKQLQENKEKGISLLDISVEKGSLEENFIAMTKGE